MDPADVAELVRLVEVQLEVVLDETAAALSAIRMVRHGVVKGVLRITLAPRDDGDSVVRKLPLA